MVSLFKASTLQINAYGNYFPQTHFYSLWENKNVSVSVLNMPKNNIVWKQKQFRIKLDRMRSHFKIFKNSFKLSEISFSAIFSISVILHTIAIT